MAPGPLRGELGGDEPLYRNNGDGTFTEVSDEAGIGHPGSAQECGILRLQWRWEFRPVRLNGENQPDTLYRNNGDGSFTDVTMDAGLGGETWAEAVTCEDYDGDGDIDLYLVVSSGPNQFVSQQWGWKFFQKRVERPGSMPVV